MRIVAVQPGPAWSVADCHAGWVEAFRQLGCHVVEFNTHDQFMFYENAHIRNGAGDWVTAIEGSESQAVAVSKHLESVLYEAWPDVVFVTYGTQLDPRTFQLARERGHVVVMYHTEAPYEDDARLKWAEAGVADLWLINDPTNIEQWRQAWPHVAYLPHSYRPALHKPADVMPRRDVCFVGTGFPSRTAWFRRYFDALGTDPKVELFGNWTSIPPGHKVGSHVIEGDGFDNPRTTRIYQTSRVGLNLYRKEATATADGWAMGPREVEMAACGLFFLTEERGENREVLPMLPTFDSPEDCAEQSRWWLEHPAKREAAAREARAAIAEWTFENRARQVLRMLEELHKTAI